MQVEYPYPNILVATEMMALGANAPANRPARALEQDLDRYLLNFEKQATCIAVDAWIGAVDGDETGEVFSMPAGAHDLLNSIFEVLIKDNTTGVTHG